ncbi:MAG TPA: hypothetical protein ENK01_01370 [Hellea balneolensis]|uniref:Uncharacterized protein n=1 Tax=Hellea balneolensis TaxID=287478 RepID=A0A7V5NWI8_9PROT|nr:hypothetical protein [Hellea balneolensis]
MSIARIIWSISLLAAIIFAFVKMDQAAMILAILGLLSGFFVDHENRLGLIAAAIFMAAGGAQAWGSIPGIGGYLNDIFGSYSTVLSAAALMTISRTTVERLFLNKAAK